MGYVKSGGGLVTAPKQQTAQMLSSRSIACQFVHAILRHMQTAHSSMALSVYSKIPLQRPPLILPKSGLISGAVFIASSLPHVAKGWMR